MEDLELREAKRKLYKRKLGKCNTCKFCNINSNKFKSYNYCNVREEYMHRAILCDWLAILFCPYYKEIKL